MNKMIKLGSFFPPLLLHFLNVNVSMVLLTVRNHPGKVRKMPLGGDACAHAVEALLHCIGSTWLCYRFLESKWLRQLVVVAGEEEFTLQ